MLHRRLIKMLTLVAAFAAVIPSAHSQPNDWRIYTPSNSSLSRSNAGYWHAVVDRYNRVWMSTGSVVAVFDDNEWHYVSTSDQPAIPNRGWITSAAEDARGDVWFGMAYEPYGAGAFRVQQTELPLDTSIWSDVPLASGNSVQDIATDGAGNTWIAWLEPKFGHWASIYRHDGTNWEETLGIPEPAFWPLALACGPDGSVYAGIIRFIPGGDPYHEIQIYDNSEWKLFATLPSLADRAAIGEIEIDTTGQFWINTGISGLLKYDGNDWTHYTTANSSIPSDTLNAIAVEAGNIIWLATPRGLARFDGSSWDVFTTANSQLPGNRVTTVAIDNNGNKWIGVGDYTTDADEVAVAVYNKDGIIDVGTESLSQIPFKKVDINSYPNPVRGQATMRYSLQSAFRMSLEIFDLLGKRVGTVDSGFKSSGKHEVTFDVSGFPSGVYFYTLTAGAFSQTRKLVVVH